MDHALYKFEEKESRYIATTKAQAEAEKKYKESLFRLAEVKRGRKSAEVAQGVVERQAEEQRIQLRLAEEELALAKEKIELQWKELEGKEVELSNAEQAAYELGQKETLASITLQIKDLGREFCLQVWIEALNAARKKLIFRS